jgi:hypothetical protein
MSMPGPMPRTKAMRKAIARALRSDLMGYQREVDSGHWIRERPESTERVLAMLRQLGQAAKLEGVSLIDVMDAVRRGYRGAQ